VTKRPLLGLTFGLAAFWIAVDQATKFWAETTLAGEPRIPLLGDWFGLVLVYNPGAAFGIGSGFIWILTVIAGVAAIGLAVLAFRVNTTLWAISVGSMLGGAISHFFDRLLRGEELGSGKIVDFLAYGNLFVGNVADIALVGAAIGGVLLSLAGKPFSEPEPPAPAPTPSTPSDRQP
jgi:signal peptidase II